MKRFAIEIEWATRYIFILLAWTFLEKSTDVYDENISNYLLFSILFYLLALVIFAAAIKDKKVHYFDNVMDWKQGCVSGFCLTLFIAILMPFAQVIIHKAIAPEFFSNMIERTAAGGNDKAATEMFNLGSYIYQSVFFTLSIGAVYSAVMAYFLQTKPKNK